MTNAIPSHPAAAAAARPRRDAGPDLVVGDIAADNPFPRPGDSVYFDVTVTNQGDQAAAPFNVHIASDGLDQEQRVEAGLQPGDSVTIARLGPLKTDQFSSLYWVQATADAGDEVAESREDNNDMWTTVIPQQPPQPPPQPPLPPIPPHQSNPRVLLAE